MELIGSINNYDWGKLGNASEVAQLASLNSDKFCVQAETPYSELWMGEHSSGPSIIKSTGEKLTPKVTQGLPFLFKVLSIRKALSIQVHPNKDEAERLHKERPDVYKDPNHKPELAIALTPFVAMCGFRPYTEIYAFCQELPPLKALLGGDEIVEQLQKNDTSAMRKCYEKLMTTDDKTTAQCIENISQNCKAVLEAHNLLEIFNTINKDFPNDVGVFSLFFLNLLRLQPGQAIFLGANVIHAYLSGDCIECMACSDNVIRAGLTPKYKDVTQLVSCLNFVGVPAYNQIFQPHRIDDHLQIFVPPVEDFAVSQLILPPVVSDYVMQVQDCNSILLVLKGERKLRLKGHKDLQLKRGSIIYIPKEVAPEIEFLLETEQKDKSEFVAYMAMKNTFKI